MEKWDEIADELFFIRQAYNDPHLTDSEKITAMKAHVSMLMDLLMKMEKKED